MHVRWYGQSAFLLADGQRRLMIDPFGDGKALAGRGLRFEYPPIEGVDADLLLITHEHFDHNNAEAVTGDPQVIRAAAGRFDTPLGEVVGIASEHDDAAGTERGANTIYRFALGGLQACHLGDLGQHELRDPQRVAIGSPDLLFIPVGGGPTIGPSEAATLVRELAPRIVVPMHYRTDALDFLEPVEPFVDEVDEEVDVVWLDEPEFDAAAMPGGGAATSLVIPRAPLDA
jgi:L-ascorbate metabolism protein UlaG (beta-lactamase superfamily)